MLVTTIKKPFSHLIPMNGFAAGRRSSGRAAARSRKDSPTCRRAKGTTLTGVEPGPRGHQLARRSAGDRRLDRGARRRRSEEQGAVPRQGGGARGAVHRHSRSRSAKTEWRFGGISYTDNGVALLTENDRVSRRTRTWILEPGAEPRKVWDRKQDAAYDEPGVAGHPARPATAAAAADAAAAAAANHPERRLHLSRRRGRIAGRRSSVPRSAEPEDADRPSGSSGRRPNALEIVRRAAER